MLPLKAVFFRFVLLVFFPELYSLIFGDDVGQRSTNKARFRFKTILSAKTLESVTERDKMFTVTKLKTFQDICTFKDVSQLT